MTLSSYKPSGPSPRIPVQMLLDWYFLQLPFQKCVPAQSLGFPSSELELSTAAEFWDP